MDNAPDWWGLELKGTSEFERVLLHGAFPEHVRQVHGYALGEPRIKQFVILYEDKSTNRWHECIVPIRPTILKEIGGILHDLNKAIDKRILPKVLNECNRGEGQYKRCPYAFLCKQVNYSQAQAASGCANQEQVVVTLGLKRRNTHDVKPTGTGVRSPANVQSGGGAAVSIRTPSGTLRVRRGAAR